MTVTRRRLKSVAAWVSPGGPLMPPIVSGMVPSTGLIAGGLAVVISGSGFMGATGVQIGASNALLVVVVNDSLMTAVTPALSIGAKTVAVTTPAGTGSLPNGFTVTL